MKLANVTRMPAKKQKIKTKNKNQKQNQKQKPSPHLSPVGHRLPPLFNYLSHHISKIPLNPHLLGEQRINKPLIVINIPRHHVQKIIHPTASSMALHNFLRPPNPFLEPPHIIRRMPRQRHFNNNPATLKCLSPIDIRPITTNQATLFKPPHPLPRRRDRQIHFLSEPRLRNTPISRKNAKNRKIVAIEFHTRIPRSTTSATTATVSPIRTSPGKCRAASKPPRRARYSTAFAPVRVTS